MKTLTPEHSHPNSHHLCNTSWPLQASNTRATQLKGSLKTWYFSRAKVAVGHLPSAPPLILACLSPHTCIWWCLHYMRPPYNWNKIHLEIHFQTYKRQKDDWENQQGFMKGKSCLTNLTTSTRRLAQMLDVVLAKLLTLAPIIYSWTKWEKY